MDLTRSLAPDMACRLTRTLTNSVQKNAMDKETFMPKVLSLSKDSYEEMVRVMRLPFRGIETTSIVGPFFWSALDQDDEDPHLRA